MFFQALLLSAALETGFLGIESGGFTMGYEHSCYHPMQPYATIIGDEIKPKYEGGYNKFFIRFEIDNNNRR